MWTTDTGRPGASQYEIKGNPDYGQLEVTLAPGESFIAEAGSMAWMSDGMQVKARILGGLFKGLLRKIGGGESLFVGEYRHELGGSVTSFSGATGHHRSTHPQ